MLDLKSISKTFNAGTVNEKTALNNLCLHLNDGDFVTVIGGNGAGKSTMLNAVAGAWPVDEGTIEIGGVNVTKLPEYKRAKYLGRVFQDPMTGTAASMQIEENMALAARRGLSRTLKKGISSKEREFYRERLAELTLLMATLKKPQLLLLDEHTAALDPKTAAKVLEATDRIVGQDNLTTLMITHNMKDAIAHGNRLVMMYEGHIIYDVAGEEKKKLHVSDLLEKFEQVSGGSFANDRMILS